MQPQRLTVSLGSLVVRMFLLVIEEVTGPTLTHCVYTLVPLSQSGINWYRLKR